MGQRPDRATSGAGGAALDCRCRGMVRQARLRAARPRSPAAAATPCRSAGVVSGSASCGPISFWSGLILAMARSRSGRCSARPRCVPRNAGIGVAAAGGGGDAGHDLERDVVACQVFGLLRCRGRRRTDGRPSAEPRCARRGRGVSDRSVDVVLAHVGGGAACLPAKTRAVPGGTRSRIASLTSRSKTTTSASRSKRRALTVSRSGSPGPAPTR